MSNIITISREFGSGGKELGKRLADELGYAYYDREIIEMLSKETNLSKEYISNISEKGIYPISFQFARTFTKYSNMQKMQVDLLVAEQKILKEIASKGNAVIIGRGANVILKEYNPINIFVYANMESKINRCRVKNENEKNISDKELEKKIISIDKERENFHKLISSMEWKNMKNYHLCINTSNMEIKKIVKSLKEMVKEYMEVKK